MKKNSPAVVHHQPCWRIDLPPKKRQRKSEDTDRTTSKEQKKPTKKERKMARRDCAVNRTDQNSVCSAQSVLLKRDEGVSKQWLCAFAGFIVHCANACIVNVRLAVHWESSCVLVCHIKATPPQLVGIILCLGLDPITSPTFSLQFKFHSSTSHHFSSSTWPPNRPARPSRRQARPRRLSVPPTRKRRRRGGRNLFPSTSTRCWSKCTRTLVSRPKPCRSWTLS